MRNSCLRVSLIIASIWLLACSASVFADPVTDAIQKAKDAAEFADGAAQDAKVAAEQAKRAVAAARDDSAAIPPTNNSVAAADSAEAAAFDAASKAQEANAAAKRAQEAAARGDDTAANKAATEAGAAAAAAGAAAVAAGMARVNAEGQRGTAESIRNTNQIPDPPTTTPPTPAQSDKLDQQEQAMTDNENQADNRKRDAEQLAKQADDLKREENAKKVEDEDEAAVRQTGEEPLRVPFEVVGFFDVFVELDLFEFPNLLEPQVVPEVEGEPGVHGRLEVELFNPNDFDVLVIDIDGLLFGDAIDFVPYAVDQIVTSQGLTQIVLGEVEFTGRPGDFTFALFDVVTDDTHPGLGPNFSVNFEVVPEPPTVWLMACALLVMAWLKSSMWLKCPRRRSCWVASF